MRVRHAFDTGCVAREIAMQGGEAAVAVRRTGGAARRAARGATRRATRRAGIPCSGIARASGEVQVSIAGGPRHDQSREAHGEPPWFHREAHGTWADL